MHPIVSALKHHKTTVALVVLEIAVTCAIIVNALFLIGDRLAAMNRVTGVADNELVWLRTSGVGDELSPAARASLAATDLAALRAVPGVQSVAQLNSLPLSRNSWSTCLNTAPGGAKATETCNLVQYMGTPGYLKTLGVKLAGGRDFLPPEYVDYTGFGSKTPPPTAVIVTQTLATRLWPGQSALGRPLFMGDGKTEHVMHVVGIVARLLNPGINKYQGVESGFLLPVRAISGGIYALRTTPAARDGVLRAAGAVLLKANDTRIITKSQRYTDTIRDFYHGDRAMVWLLVVVVACLLALTALGVVGLSSFWVQQRTRQIGIRRAIGATRHDILRYFQIENLLIVGAGIVLGSLGAVVLNLWLMKHYELARMPLAWLVAGAVVLWTLGQLAVLGPALRAAMVPPVVATRSV